MTSIEDFISHRWADAKEELRKLDPSFVAKYEEVAVKANAEDSTLSMPNPTLWLPGQGLVDFFVHREPINRLSENWYRLFEGCFSLADQATIVRTAAKHMTAQMYQSFLGDDVGMVANYHFHSWVIHLKTLCDRVEYVGKRTTRLYVSDPKARKDSEKGLENSLRLLKAKIETLRHEFAHGKSDFAVKGMTELNLWEKHIAVGFTVESLLDRAHANMENGIKHGLYDRCVDEAERYFSDLGLMLYELEQDIPNCNTSAPVSD